MKIDGTPYRSVWVEPAMAAIRCASSTRRRLPWSLDILRLTHVREAAHAIRSMQVRGAPLIGAVAAYGLAMALRHDATAPTPWSATAALLGATRPTAVNLRWALERMLTRAAQHAPGRARRASPIRRRTAIADEDVRQNEAIGVHGLPLIAAAAAQRTPNAR